jgi:antitoxin (DNA-binding transcriptional repressor) of toxin-antitoxin stability system
MTMYSVADAKNMLSELIDRALRGEGVTITRHGAPVVEIRAVTPPPRAVTADDLALLERIRYRPDRPPAEDAARLVSRLRDEGEH